MDIVYATQTAFVGGYKVVAGTHWPADDPIVLASPSLFSDDPSHGLNCSAPPEARAETATAAPGEQRRVRRG
jgi:hypothetical protein